MTTIWRCLLIALLANVACSNEFRIGATTFHVLDNQQLWSDLPEAMRLMQGVPDVPADVWDTTVHLYPPHREIGVSFVLCLYDQRTGELRARTTETDLAVIHSCIPHEFAHRWRHIDLGILWTRDSELHHDAEWAWRFDVLENAAAHSWLARRLQQ